MDGMGVTGVVVIPGVKTWVVDMKTHQGMLTDVETRAGAKADMETRVVTRTDMETRRKRPCM